jgi:hypothetical protein
MRRKAFSWTLPAEIEARLGESTYGRQRAIAEADHLLLVLHTPPEPDTHERSTEVFLWKPDGAVWWNGAANGEPKLRKLLAWYRERLEHYDAAYERAASASDLFDILDDLASLSRASVNLSAAIQAGREARRGDKLLIAMRDEAYEISREFELLFHDAKLALDYRMARSAEQQMAKAQELATAQHKLNVLAAVTFPLMAVSTIFGMNLVHGLEDQPAGLFWFILACGGVIGGVAVTWMIGRTDFLKTLFDV